MMQTREAQSAFAPHETSFGHVGAQAGGAQTSFVQTPEVHCEALEHGLPFVAGPLEALLLEALLLDDAPPEDDADAEALLEDEALRDEDEEELLEEELGEALDDPAPASRQEPAARRVVRTAAHPDSFPWSSAVLTEPVHPPALTAQHAASCTHA